MGVFGIAAFLAGFAIHVAASDRFDGIELPLGDAEGLGVDAKGRIYVGSPSYGRIQRYEPDGRFDRGWALRAGKGRLAFAPRGSEMLIIDGDRQEHVVRQSVVLWLAQSPLPAWIFAFAGTVLYWIGEALRRSARPARDGG